MAKISLIVNGNPVNANVDPRTLLVQFLRETLRQVRHQSRVAALVGDLATENDAKRLADEIGAKAMSAEEAVRGADVVVTVTHASEPVLKGEWLDHDVHVNAVGAVGRSTRELDGVAVQRSTVIVDSRAAAEQEAGDIVMAGATIYAELGELIAGKVPAPPTEGRTVFKSLGLAVEDLAAARLVYEAFA